MPIHLTNRRGFLLGLAGVAVTSTTVTATRIRLRGRLFAVNPEEGNTTFSIDPEGESESITMTTNLDGYVTDYLRGSEGRLVTITIEPDVK